MELGKNQYGDTTVLTIAGNIDAFTAGEVTGFFDEQITGDQKKIVLDLSQVDFMSSAGLRAILSALKESRKQGGDLRLAAAQPGVANVLEISGFTSILKTYPTVEEAVESISRE